MGIQFDPDLESLCIGECYLPQKPFTEMYWAKWALDLMGEGFTLRAPAVTYERKTTEDHDVIIRTNVWKGTHHIYKLQDKYDSKGRRLGVWPD